jgi:hypothetical protein
LRLRFPFLGDGIVWIDKIENGDTFFHFEPLATAVATFVARRAASPRAAAGYPAIVCGVLYVVGIAWLVRRVWSDSRPQALAALLLAIHPTILLFFGYIESYPMLLVLQTGFALTLASRAGWWSLIGSALFLGVAIASHLQSLAWLPALWVVAWMAPGGGRAARWGRELATTAIALGVAALVVRALGPSPLALLGKLRGATGMSGVDAEVLFAPYRSAEMLNEIVLILAPQLVLGPARRRRRRERIAAPWPALAALPPGPLLFFILFVPASHRRGTRLGSVPVPGAPVTLLGQLWRRPGTAPRAE